MRFAAAALVSSVLFAGCSPLVADGLKHPEQPIKVRYEAAPSHTFVSPDWMVDNYVVDTDGRFVREKTSDEYVLRREADFDGSGLASYTAHRFILKLVHRKTGGVLFSQLVPLSAVEKDRELEVLLADYVDALSGTGFFAEALPSGKKELRAQQYAAKIVDKKPRKVGRFEGLEATIELANLDQLKLDPSARSATIRVVLARTGYSHQFLEGPRYVRVPLMLVIGLHEKPAYFASSSKDLDTFVQEFELGAAP